MNPYFLISIYLFVSDCHTYAHPSVKSKAFFKLQVYIIMKILSVLKLENLIQNPVNVTQSI